MSGGKGAWERAASSVDTRVCRAAGSTVVGVARTRAVSACLVAAICFCLAFFATRSSKQILVLQNKLMRDADELNFDVSSHMIGGCNMYEKQDGRDNQNYDV